MFVIMSLCSLSLVMDLRIQGFQFDYCFSISSAGDGVCLLIEAGDEWRGETSAGVVSLNRMARTCERETGITCVQQNTHYNMHSHSHTVVMMMPLCVLSSHQVLLTSRGEKGIKSRETRGVKDSRL